MKKTTIYTGILTGALVLSLVGCGSSNQSTSASGGKKDPIVVGSKNNTENYIQGEMFADILEANHVPVVRKLNLGGTNVTFQAIKSGQVDMYPEYTGTGLVDILKKPLEKDQKKVLTEVSDGFKQWNIEWLQPAPLNSTYGFAVKKATAEKYNLKTISDLAKHSKDLVLSFPQEFDVRPDALPGLQKYYKDQGGFKFKNQFQIDYSLRYQPLMQGKSDVTVSVGSDGDVAGNHLVVLKDDIEFFPAYNVAPIISDKKLKEYPQIKAPLEKLMSLLTDEQMQKLDWEVDGPDKKEIKDVAKDFLTKNGLLK
ncbi:ABC transporter substrate-binding protein [Neobacillus cucumis]|uniref:ABC transporter substrate-binding protein n=1 Tax=Neobacillus cucumis TaxID=1740721 RepID=UPI0019628CCA|nr:glycine betaine ABC transporter substrate-binding protein [Neobacillus cucumis]MBM7650742.1 osmoprotectant transport system substrate-binding protein [Neobacillus cucumis]